MRARVRIRKRYMELSQKAAEENKNTHHKYARTEEKKHY